jgi:colanic acid/amylovoran biosynthesis glycosyltransferase
MPSIRVTVMTAPWELPAGPWVLHSSPLLGNLTERWIQVQADADEDIPSRIIGLELADGQSRRGDWLLTSDRRDLWLAYKGMFKSGGISTMWLAQAFRQSPPVALHCHYGPPAAQQRWLAKALDCRFVASFYGYDACRTKYVQGPIWRRRYRALFTRTDAIIVEGPAMAARVLALGCSEKKIAIVRLPADAAGLASCQRPKPDFFRVVVAGRFVEKKGFDIALRAFGRALRGKDAQLLLVGGGPLEAEYRKIIAEERLATQVKWAGRLPFSEFMGCVSTGHLAMHPSRTARNGDSEGGAPVTLIEAQWLGVPGLVSDHDDLPFVAAPGGSVVLNATDEEQWAEALRSLYENPGELTRMGLVAGQFAAAYHSPGANAAARKLIYTGRAAGRRTESIVPG